MADGLVSVPSAGFVARGLGVLEDSTWQVDFIGGGGWGGAFLRASTARMWNASGVLDVAPVNTLRMDRAPLTHGMCGALLEGSRTNLIQDSEDFSVVGWGKTRATVLANQTVAPSGETTADKLVEDSTATASHMIDRFYAFTAGSVYVQSVYAKAGERTAMQMRFPSAGMTWGPSNEPRADFDLAAGTVSAVSGASAGTCYAEMTPAGNGWYRCVLVATCQDSTSSALRILLLNGGTTTYTGNGTSGIFIWGAQLEAGMFASSYIQTLGAAATRAPESALVNGLENIGFNPVAGTLVIELTPMRTVDATYGFPLMIHQANSMNNRITLEHTASGNLTWRVTSGGVTQVSALVTGGGTAGVTTRLALAYENGRFSSCRDGGAIVEQLSGSLPSGMNRLALGSYNGTGDFWSGWVRRLVYYPVALGNDQLRELSRL